MKHADFVHLHVHTQYSLLDGMIFVERLVARAAELRMPAVAITDHGQMHGVVDFYSHAMKAGLKPILGVEAYIAPGNMRERSGGAADAANHLTLLARDETGYRNLVRLTSAANLEGFYYKPRVDKAFLRGHAAGVIALSGCLKGEVAQKILRGDAAGAEKAALELREIFGDGNFYLELQANGLAEQERANAGLAELGRRLGIATVATNDCHYLRQEDAPVHEVLLCINSGKTLQDQDRMRIGTDQLYFRTPEEMARLFAGAPEALRATIEIAERCNVGLKLGEFRFPAVEVPPGETPATQLRHLAAEGLAGRLGPGADAAARGAYEERLAYELGVIEKMDFPSYFLAVADFVHYAKASGIPVGPGRGSAAGSLAAWALGITDLDPLKYGLLFERFLDPGRKSMPDIDVDFEQNRRDEVIDYVRKKYGEDRVAQIVTFGKLKAKAVIRDVGRVLGMQYGEVDKISKLVPADAKMTLKRALEEEPRLAELRDNDPQVARLLEIAESLEGLNRHASTHASGVLISPEPLENLVPLFKDQKKDVRLTQFDMGGIEAIGLVKFDFLGLITLTVIQDAVRLIRAGQPPGEKPFDIADIPLDDPATYQLLASGRTAGIFQFESSGMRDTVVRMRPDKLDDLIALNALYRPGALEAGNVTLYLERRSGKQKVQYRHPVLRETLEATYGIPVYQEQVMQIATVLAGFTPAEADDLRKAMGKKKVEVMAQQKEKFVAGAAAKHKVPAALAEEIFNEIEHFAGYGFNKSHSAAYAFVAYQTAWLKTHHPREYLAALLTSEVADTDKIVQYIAECREMGITVLPPDVNQSERSFTVVPGGIRFGLAAVKNVGEGAIESIVAARAGGPFVSLFDFCARIDLRRVNRRVLESLVKCGAFDSLGARRAQLWEALDVATEAAAGAQRDRTDGQISLFAAAPQPVMEPRLPEVPEWPERQLLAGEKEALGFFVTGHPLAEFARELAKLTTPSRSFGELAEGAEVRVGGLVTAVKNYNDRKGDPMAFVTLEDLDGSFEVTIFSKLWKTCAQLVVPDAAVVVIGKANVSEAPGGREGAKPVVKILADEVLPIAQARERLVRSVHLRLLTPGLERATLDALGRLVRRHRGSVPLFVHLITPQHSEAVLRAGGGSLVRPAPELVSELEELLGKDAVNLR
ncbi:MAG TPA: DNA polymerase III subunit alpha [bacterium]